MATSNAAGCVPNTQQPAEAQSVCASEGEYLRTLHRSMMVWVLLLAGVGAAAAAPVKVCFELPGTHPVRVTVAAVDKDDPTWIVSHIAYGTVFADGETTGCVSWNGLDENGWPVPTGTYGLKGIVTQAHNWTGDGKYHTVAPQFEGAITPFNISLTAPASEQKLFVDGDPVGQSFSTVATSANFPGRAHYANFYHAYLENSFNNYQLDLTKPHGYPQAVNRWHSAGIGGGSATATDGRSIWSFAESFAKYLYRGEPGSENLAVWGSCNFSQFYAFPGIVCIPPGVCLHSSSCLCGSPLLPCCRPC